jgi:hypothetical protein
VSARYRYRVGTLALQASTCLLVACAPSLNWRELQLGRLSTLLPCKPDTASRPVELGGQTLTMDMAGCEASGALFAISRIQAANPAQAATLMTSLREARLAHIAQAVVHPVANSGDALTSFDVQVDGRRADGTPLQARFKWLLAEREVYQIAAYAEHLRTEQTESLIAEVRIR